MTDKRSEMPELPPGRVHVYQHDDGTECHYRAHWVGNVRDGHWAFSYWYWDAPYWWYCGEHN